MARKRVLVVQDEEDIAELIEHNLVRGGAMRPGCSRKQAFSFGEARSLRQDERTTNDSLFLARPGNNAFPGRSTGHHVEVRRSAELLIASRSGVRSRTPSTLIAFN